MEISGQPSPFTGLGLMAPTSADSPLPAAMGLHGLAAAADLNSFFHSSSQQLQQMQMFALSKQAAVQQQLQQQMSEMESLMKQYRQQPPQPKEDSFTEEESQCFSPSDNNSSLSSPTQGYSGAVSTTNLLQTIKVEAADDAVTTTIDRKPVVQSLKPSATSSIPMATTQTHRRKAQSPIATESHEAASSDPRQSSPPGLIPLASLHNPALSVLTPSPPPTMATTPSPLGNTSLLANQMAAAAALASQHTQLSQVPGMGMLPTAADTVSMAMNPMIGSSIARALAINGGSSGPGGLNNPRRPRSEKKPIPSELKDTRYFERRKRNNMAAKKSRDARKMREDDLSMRAGYLEKENAVLRAQVATLREEANSLRQLLLQKRARAGQ